eukprot:CAMPEP_0184503050 /NCGR_PEP_ID=MMETSP0113_2-20130426/51656_1 /TAXON_ID=91329 /ORGANISM="Norrisiella sphaerica, Strain BC52" /LENGTH=259 /DNA_ID=CAMNT_0026892463 /DNA_START=462 /DNA_END=1241 /DNA_ORIENTATION=-
MVVVGGSLYQDVYYEHAHGRLFIMLRLWRFGRVFHSLWLAEHEANQWEIEGLRERVRDLEAQNRDLIIKTSLKRQHSTREEVKAALEDARIFRLIPSCEYPCVATRDEPAITAKRGRDVGMHGQIIRVTTDPAVEGKCGNVFLKLLDEPGWVFIYDYDDDTYKAIKNKQLLEELEILDEAMQTGCDALVLEDYEDVKETQGESGVREGDIVEVVEISDNWCHVENNYNGSGCWVPSVFLMRLRRIDGLEVVHTDDEMAE